jgi:hypothetical protein
MSIIQRKTDTPVVIKQINGSEAIVISTPEVVNILGEPREVVPSQLVRAVGMTVPLADRMIDSLSGRIVRLTDESIQLMRANDVVLKNGFVSGEKCLVGKSKAGRLGLAPKDTQLMTEHDDLEILGGLALAIRDQEPEQRSNQQVCER